MNRVLGLKTVFGIKPKRIFNDIFTAIPSCFQFSSLFQLPDIALVIRLLYIAIISLGCAKGRRL